jgi:hypothetical protein
MYHYVREINNWNGIHPLSPQQFSEQIDLIHKSFEIVSPDDLSRPSPRNRCVLTFDDSTSDQFEFAFNILNKKGIPAYFSVMSGPLITGIIPLFHLVHTVLSFKSDEEIWEHISAEFDIENIENESEIYSYESSKFRRYNKYMLNFKINESEARIFLESLFQDIFPDPEVFIKDFYLTKQNIKQMHASGMIIGVHCHHHSPYSGDAQVFLNKEVLTCKNYLETELNIKAEWYTPAFGGGEQHIKMIAELTPLLQDLGFKGGFTTNKGVIKNTESFWYNRIDCSQLPPKTNSSLESVLSQYML